MEAGLVFACDFLARRERSENQVRKALRDEGLEKPEVIDYIVDTLRQKSYLDDRRFASGLSEYLTMFRGAGPGMVRKKLAEAGVSSGIIDDIVGSSFSGVEEKQVALRLAEKRISMMRGADPRKAASRVRGYLLRRGFSGAIVSDICCDILRGEFSGEA
jgi:regulatory protein